MTDPYRPGSWWPSRLNDYRHCLQFGKLKHEDKVIPQSENIDTAFGTGVHLGLNEILIGGDGEELFKLFWDTCKHLPREFKFGWEALGEMGPVFLARFKRLHAKHFRPVHMEERLFGSLGPYAVEGTPDYLGYFKDEPAVVDFKTSSRPYAKEIIHSHDQTVFYAHLAKQQINFHPKRKVLYVFVKDATAPRIQVLEKCLTETEICETLENVKAEIADYSTRKTHPKNYTSCVSGPLVCPGFKICFPDGVTNEGE